MSTQKDIKVVALDIDGTTFKNGQGPISPRVKEAVQAARDCGVKVALCTGRWYSIMVNFCHELGMAPEDLHVTSNGSVVLNTRGDIFDTVPVDTQALHALIDPLSERGIGYGMCDALNFYANANGFDAHVDQSQFVLVKDDAEFKKLNYISKIYVNCGEENVAFVESLLKPLPLEYACDFVGEFDIWPRATNKGVALSKLAHRYGTDIDHLMFVGDGTNDLMALSMAGLGVAMGQAEDHVKKQADVIAPPFSEDGAAWAIEEFVLKK